MSGESRQRPSLLACILIPRQFQALSSPRAPRTNAITRSLLILLEDKSWEQIMEYRPLPCISAGVWAAEGMTKDEGMVHSCGRPAPKQGWSVWGSSKEHEWKRCGVFHITHTSHDRVLCHWMLRGARSKKGEDLLRIMPIKHSGLQGRLQSGQAAFNPFPLFRRKLIKMRTKTFGKLRQHCLNPGSSCSTEI